MTPRGQASDPSVESTCLARMIYPTCVPVSRTHSVLRGLLRMEQLDNLDAERFRELHDRRELRVRLAAENLREVALAELVLEVEPIERPVLPEDQLA